VGPGTMMLIGGLSAPILPLYLGTLDVTKFCNEIDGTRTIPELIQVGDELERRNREGVLRKLMQVGLIEEAAQRSASESPATTRLASFLGRVADTTRCFTGRAGALAAVMRPVDILCTDAHLAERLRETLAAAGLRVRIADATTERTGQLTIVAAGCAARQ
jgi:hypothetical protein